MDWLLKLVGALLVLLALADIFMTVLYARSGAGIITPGLSKGTWILFKGLAPRQGRARAAWLSFAGPMILVVTAATWFSLLTLGFAFVAWPALGSSIQASSGPTPTDLAAALYYSGYSLTTLGTGDLVPQTAAYRLIMVAEAAIGFSALTLTLTYFMSIYSALVRRNTLAQGLHQTSAGTADAAEIVARLGAGNSFVEASSLLSDTAYRVLDLLESHHSYPVIHYFRRSDPRYAMARVALLTMDTASLIKTALGREHEALKDRAAVEMLWGSGMALLEEVGRSFLPDDAAERSACDASSSDNEARFGRALCRLRQAAIAAAEDDEGRAAYLARRREWEGLTRAFARLMGYRWQEIEPRAGRD